MAVDEPDEARRQRLWALALGAESDSLSRADQRLNDALSALYDSTTAGSGGGLNRSSPSVARWLGDIREFFPSSVVQVIQRDALERMGLREMLLEPELLAAMEADIHLVADLIALQSVVPEKTRATARMVVATVVQALMEKLERKTSESLRGAVNKSQRTTRPRFQDIDWPATIRANLHQYQPEYQTVVPERLKGFMRKQRRLVDLDEVVLCVDQSGSMAASVVYSSIFAAVMATLPVVRTRLICFDTSIVDMTEALSDPVEALFGVQLGGGTDINQAVAWCQDRIEQPGKAHLVLITDLYEGGDSRSLLVRLARLVFDGVNVIVLLALTDTGRPSYDAGLAGEVAALGIPVFACTPDQFPDLMACALKRQNIKDWAADSDIQCVREKNAQNEAGLAGSTGVQPASR